VTAARHLRALTLALSSQLLFAGEPMEPDEIVVLFLDGNRIRQDRRTQGASAK
jgi:hypothetical protein